MQRNTRIDILDHLPLKIFDTSTTINLDLVACAVDLVCGYPLRILDRMLSLSFETWINPFRVNSESSNSDLHPYLLEIHSECNYSHIVTFISYIKSILRKESKKWQSADWKSSSWRSHSLALLTKQRTKTQLLTQMMLVATNWSR